MPSAIRAGWRLFERSLPPDLLGGSQGKLNLPLVE
jgi:hypothetical protein